MSNEDKPREEVVSEPETTNSTAELVHGTPDGEHSGTAAGNPGTHHHLPPPQSNYHPPAHPTPSNTKRPRRHPIGARRVRRGTDARERCSRCGSHDIRTEFTTTGILLGVFCFPCGLLCCLSMMDAACYNCGEPYPIDGMV